MSEKHKKVAVRAALAILIGTSIVIDLLNMKNSMKNLCKLCSEIDNLVSNEE